MKNPRGATVCAEIQACSTDSPSLSKVMHTIRHAIAPPSKERWLEDGLPAHMIQSTQE